MTGPIVPAAIGQSAGPPHTFHVDGVFTPAEFVLLHSRHFVTFLSRELMEGLPC